MRCLILTFFIALISLMTSCREDFVFENSTGDLQFSRDTIYLDTVFSNISSSTYALKVYNKSDKDIKIPTIKLGKGLDSKYRMNIDGMIGDNGKVFRNVEMLARDSMYIFIETTADIIDANPDDFLYTDKILFDSGENEQSVELVTLIKDAVFLFPQRNDEGEYESIQIDGRPVYGFFLSHNDPINGDEFEFTSDKPYVIYGFAAVPGGETLVVRPGARVYFHDNSGIIVGQGASIQVGQVNSNPTPQTQVIFQGDRLEPSFSKTAGQWFGIWMSSGSLGGTFEHVTIKNAQIGLWIQNNADLMSIKNTQIYDCSFYGILTDKGRISAENMVINNAGSSTLACRYGGEYEFTHCTFNNNWPSSQHLTVFISDYIQNAVPEVEPLTQATFNNCIIYGSNQIEMLLEKRGATFNYHFNHCIIKFNDFSGNLINTGLYNFNSDLGHYNTCYISTNSSQFNPRFWDVNNNKLQIDDDSQAIGKADLSFLIPNDIIGVFRISNDLGAYQNSPNN